MPNEVLKYSLNDFVSQQYTKIDMGIVPSRDIHFGFVFSLLHGLEYLAANANSILEVTVTDSTFDPQMGNDFVPYTAMPCGCPQHRLLREHVVDEIYFILKETCHEMGIAANRTFIDLWSERTRRDKNTANQITKMIIEREYSAEIKRALFDSGNRPYFVPFSVNCSLCGHTNSHYGQVSYEDGTLASKCHNVNCGKLGQETRVPVDRFDNINNHYLIDPIRDVFPNPKPPFSISDQDPNKMYNGLVPSSVHIFGGDYDAVHGVKRIPKFERVRQIMQTASESIPDIFIAPLILLDGQKVSKSKYSFFRYLDYTFEDRRRFIQYARQIMRSSEGSPVINYTRRL